MKKAVIVIPTFNEANNIETLVHQIFKVTRDVSNWNIHVLVVDSSSPDGTSDLVIKLQKKFSNLHLLDAEKRGLGKAYAKGFAYAIDEFDPFVIFEMDADLSHDPITIPKFLDSIEKGADFVIGSRYIKGGSIPKDWDFHRKLFSILGNIVIRLGFMKIKIADWTSGFRAIKTFIIKDALSNIEKYSGYVFQVALLDFAIKKGAIIREIPIQFTDRLHGKSKINSIQYIVQTLLYTFFHSSFVRYVLVGLCGFSIDFGVSYILIERIGLALWLATVISAETAIIFNFTLNNFWSFAYKKLEAKGHVYLSQFIKFNIIASGSLFIQAAGIELLAFIFGPQWWYIYKVFILAFIVIPYSYILYNRVVWKTRDKISNF